MWKKPLAKSKAFQRREEKQRKGHGEVEQSGAGGAELLEDDSEGVAAVDTDEEEVQVGDGDAEHSEEADRQLEYLVARQAELKENIIDNEGAEETDEENQNKRPRLMSIDGSESSSSDNDDEIEELIEPRQQKKLRKSSSKSVSATESSSTTDVNENEEQQRGSNIGSITIDGVKVTAVKDKLGRPHIAYGHSGKAYVFYHSRQPSSIALHLSNIDSIIKSLSQEERDKMKVLVLSADDGYDWSLKVNITDHLLGLVWKRYNLDGIIMVKNAPGDSRWNEIERFWSFLTLRHKGLTIPDQLPEMNANNRDKEEADNYVLDEGIKALVNIDKGIQWDGHNVTPVGLFHEADEVEIDGIKVANNFISEELYEKRKKLIESTNTFRTISETDPEFAKDCILFNKHYDRRCHFFMVGIYIFNI